MKKLFSLIIFFGLLLSGCETGTSVYKGPLYYVTVKHEDTKETFLAAASSRGLAINKATTNCQNKYPTTKTKCFVDSTTTVENNAKKLNKTDKKLNETDQKIAYAKGVCEKVGYTPDTDDFRDCTIKLMTAPSGSQTVVVGSGNNQRLLRPYPLGCRSMGGNWNC